MDGAWRRELLPVLLLATAPLLAYAPALREGRLLAPGDGKALHLPLRTEAWRALARGDVPSWNAASFSGCPLLAAYRPGVFHPLMAALTPLGPETAFQALVLTSLSLSAAMAFLYARRIGAGRVGAVVAGLGFGLGPYLVAHLGDTATVVAAPSLPLLLLAAEGHLERGRATSAAALAGALALLLLAGSREAVGAGGLLLGARLGLAHGVRLLRAERTDRRAGRPPGVGLLSIAAALAAGAALAAPQLLPTALALREAGPGGAGAAEGQAAVLGGISGLIVRYVSHTPAPALALAAVPLLASHPALRATGAVVGGFLVLLVARGGLDTAGALPLAFDLALALLAGLSLSVQWEARRKARGLRLLCLVAALASAAALSIAATVTGPLPERLAGPVGLLAIALVLYFRLAESKSPVAAHAFLLPLTASFLLQPYGREAWGGAPTVDELARPGPTREAIDLALGPRREERTLTLVTAWPRGYEEDLAYANLASLADRRNAEGYDPLVPAVRRRVFDGMGADGTVRPEFFETDPGRLELLGVRWVQVPTASLSRPADADGLGERVDVILEPGRPRLFALPITRATEVRIASFLSGATRVGQGEIVAECVVRLATGREVWFPLRAGVETAEWAIEREDVARAVRHRRARVLSSFPVREGFLGHQYLAILRLPGRFWIDALRFRAWPGAPPLTVLRAGVRDLSGPAVGVSAVSGYLSEDVRLAEAAATPRVRLFQVRRGVGRAAVVAHLRRLPDEERVLDLLRSPTRLGVDSGRGALAVAGEVEGVVLPPDSRPSAAVLVRAAGGRLVVRAAGPGLLVVGEGWDPGWRARVDGEPARVLRVNVDRMGVVLPPGPHRVLLLHRARGLAAGCVLAFLALVALVAAVVRERGQDRAAV